MRAQRLTAKSGKQMMAVVRYHAPIHATGTTACGRPFASLRAGEFPTEQTSACGAFSNVNCPECLEVVSRPWGVFPFDPSNMYPTSTAVRFCRLRGCAERIAERWTLDGIAPPHEGGYVVREVRR